MCSSDLMMLFAGTSKRLFIILKTLLQNAPRSDWSSRLFAGIAYFQLGRKTEGENCIRDNIDYGCEKNVSGHILDLMKQGTLNPGGNAVQTLRRIIIPLSIPGIKTGITMVFVPSVSTFVISQMLGGGSNQLTPSGRRKSQPP